jgi:hypothetical protein
VECSEGVHAYEQKWRQSKRLRASSLLAHSVYEVCMRSSMNAHVHVVMRGHMSMHAPTCSKHPPSQFGT